MALVMYDLDGTLLDTADEIAQAVNLTLNEFGLESVSVDQVRNWIGHGTGWLMKRAWEEQKGSADAVSDADWDKVMKRFVHHYEATAGTTSTPFPHVLETLRKASDYGVKQAVVTNKERRFADRILEKHGLTDQFDLVICGDSLSVKKPNPAVITHCLNTLGATQGESLFIGDSEIDGKKTEQNLPLALQNIQILELIKEKTAGNLNEQETDLINQVLVDLKSKYANA